LAMSPIIYYPRYEKTADQPCPFPHLPRASSLTTSSTRCLWLVSDLPSPILVNTPTLLLSKLPRSCLMSFSSPPSPASRAASSSGRSASAAVTALVNVPAVLCTAACASACRAQRDCRVSTTRGGSTARRAQAYREHGPGDVVLGFEVHIATCRNAVLLRRCGRCGEVHLCSGGVKGPVREPVMRERERETWNSFVQQGSHGRKRTSAKGFQPRVFFSLGVCGTTIMSPSSHLS
jgi:hypothetical protein